MYVRRYEYTYWYSTTFCFIIYASEYVWRVSYSYYVYYTRNTDCTAYEHEPALLIYYNISKHHLNGKFVQKKLSWVDVVETFAKKMS